MVNVFFWWNYVVGIADAAYHTIEGGGAPEKMIYAYTHLSVWNV